MPGLRAGWKQSTRCNGNCCTRPASLAKLPAYPYKEHAMVRLLFWIALIAAAVWLWRRFKSSQRRPNPPTEQDATPMVRCAHCGVHIPRHKALPQQQHWYCSQNHLQLGAKHGG